MQAVEALRTAVGQGHTEMIRRLAARHVDLNSRDEQRRPCTPPSRTSRDSPPLERVGRRAAGIGGRSEHSGQRRHDAAAPGGAPWPGGTRGKAACQRGPDRCLLGRRIGAHRTRRRRAGRRSDAVEQAFVARPAAGLGRRGRANKDGQVALGSQSRRQLCPRSEELRKLLAAVSRRRLGRPRPGRVAVGSRGRPQRTW